MQFFKSENVGIQYIHICVLRFKVVIFFIYEVLVHTSTYLMLKSMIFVPFNTNIITILYILIYIFSEKILISCSCYPGFGLNYLWFKTTKCWYLWSSSIFVWNFMDVYLWYLSCDIYYYYYSENIILWIR